MHNKLTIIIISYNSSHAVKNCIAPLLDLNTCPCTIIDNASPDESAKKLSMRFPKCSVVELDKNVGYGRATNIGLKKVQTPYAILLNPDLYATSETMEKMLTHAIQKGKNAAILAPAVKKVDFTGAPPQSVQSVSGSAMLFNMEQMKDIGFFDENIFLFSEETDLCRRTIDSGHQILLCHDVYMEHLKGQSSPPNPEVEYMKDWHFGWSSAYYFTKHNMATGKHAPRRMARLYKLKSLLATDPKKAKKYKARYDGTRAFLAGEAAFRADGSPQASPKPQPSS